MRKKNKVIKTDIIIGAYEGIQKGVVETNGIIFFVLDLLSKFERRR